MQLGFTFFSDTFSLLCSADIIKKGKLGFLKHVETRLNPGYFTFFLVFTCSERVKKFPHTLL